MRRIAAILTLVVGTLGVVTAPQAASAGAVLPRRVVTFVPHWTNGVNRSVGRYVTHLVYAFADNDPVTGALRSREGSFTTDPAIRSMKAVRATYTRVKLMLGLGGGGSYSRNIAAVSQTATGRQRLAVATAATVKRLGFQGVDLDWESPDRKLRTTEGITESAAFTDLVMRMRRELSRINRYYELSADVGGAKQYYWDGPGMTNDYDWARIVPALTFVNVMAYDLRGDWNAATLANGGWDGGGTGFNAGLVQLPNDPNPGQNVSAYVANLRAAGVPAYKLVLGVPFYGRLLCRTQPGPNNDGLRQPFVARSCSGSSTRSYRSILAFVAASSGWRSFRHPTAKVPWYYHPGQQIFITYDDPTSIAYKRNWAVARGLGGVMSWEVTQDTSTLSLLRALSGR